MRVFDGNLVPDIESVETREDGTVIAKLQLPMGEGYKVIFAAYRDGELADMDIATVTVASDGECSASSARAITLNAGDKVMVWRDLATKTAMCAAYKIR